MDVSEIVLRGRKVQRHANLKVTRNKTIAGRHTIHTSTHHTVHTRIIQLHTDAVDNEVPLPTHNRPGCIQIPAGVCCCRRGRKYPPMPASAEEMKLHCPANFDRSKLATCGVCVPRLTNLHRGHGETKTSPFWTWGGQPTSSADNLCGGRQAFAAQVAARGAVERPAGLWVEGLRPKMENSDP